MASAGDSDLRTCEWRKSRLQVSTLHLFCEPWLHACSHGRDAGETYLMRTDEGRAAEGLHCYPIPVLAVAES